MSEQDVTPGGAMPVALMYDVDPWWHFGSYTPFRDPIRLDEDDPDYGDARTLMTLRKQNDWIVS